jgi:transposase
VSRKGCPNHPIDFKRRVAALACVAGVSVAKLALAHGINANLLFKWRRHYRAGKFGASGADALVAGTTRETAAKLLPVLAPPARSEPLSLGTTASCIEIVLTDATVRVCGEVSGIALRTVLDCLARRP